MKKRIWHSVVRKMFLTLNIFGFTVFGASLCLAQAAAPELTGDTNKASETKGSAWASIFPDGLMDSKGVDVPLERLEGKLVGLYFSASWCAPCHRFTPILAKFKNQHKENFEVVLVGRDSVKAKQLGYMEKHNMPFPSTKWSEGKNAQSDNLAEKHKVNAIPRLVILSSKGQLIMDDARNAIESTPENVTELFTNKEKRNKLVVANAEKLAQQDEAAQVELQNKIKKYKEALQETFPVHGEDHKTTRFAHYTFDATADDSLKKSPAFTLENAPYQGDALSLNGKFYPKDNGYIANAFFSDLSYTQFSLGHEFLVRDLNKRIPTAIIVGGKGYRWFGLKCDAKGGMELFFNNGRFSRKIPDVKIAPNEWNRILSSVDLHQGVVKIWLNGKLLPEVKLPEDFMLDVMITAAVDREKNFLFKNYSNREAIDGLVDNLVIYDGSFSDTEIAKEAEDFGSRWVK